MTVRFKAGGIDEMRRRLFTWGKGVTVEKPARLRRRLAGMCAARAGHRSAANAGRGGGLRRQGDSRYGTVNGGARAER